MTLIEFCLILCLIFITVRTVRFATKRIRLLLTLIRLKRYDGVRVEIYSPRVFLYPWQSKKSAATVEVGGKHYAIRIFNGRGYPYSVHLASPEFASVFVKSDGGVRLHRLGNRSLISGAVLSGVYLPRTVYMPKREDNEGDIPVTVLSPAPREVTYVTPNKSSVAIAFPGDRVNGELIFTAKTFDRFIDRDSRGFFEDQSSSSARSSDTLSR